MLHSLLGINSASFAAAFPQVSQPEFPARDNDSKYFFLKFIILLRRWDSVVVDVLKCHNWPNGFTS